MLRATLRSLLARKLRLALSGLAIVLSVSFISGTYVLTDTMGRVFDDLFASANSHTAVTVRGVSALTADNNPSSSVDREPVAQSVLDSLRTVDGVREAVGHSSGYAQVVDKKGHAVKTGGAPSIGLDINAASVQESLTVKRGKPPVGPHQAAIDVATARKVGLVVGDRIKVLLKGPAATVTITGLVGLGNTDNFAGASLVAFDPPTAQKYVGIQGAWTEISLAAQPGVSQEELVKRVSAVLPKGVEAVTAKTASDEASKEIKNGLGFFNTALLVFGFISLFVGGFLIFNTFTMLVAQRTRELALLRALGASRRQVTRSVMIESVLVGLLSSIAGFGLGILVAKGLQSLLDAVGISLPKGHTVVATRTLVVSILVGTGMTALAALMPALRAARVAPVQAMRESGPAEDRSLRRRTITGGVVLGLGVLALSIGLAEGQLALVGLGAVLTFLGVALLSPLFARPAVRVLGTPFTRSAGGRIGRGNAMRSPRRTSATAAALMIGLALVAAVSTIGASAKKSIVKVVDTSLGADYVLHTDQFMPFSPEVAKALEGKPELGAVAAFRFGQAKISDENGATDVRGVNPSALEAVLKLTTLKGSLDSLNDGQLAISESEAKKLKVSTGDRLDVTWSRTGFQPMTVGAVYKDNQFAGGYLLSDTVFDRNVTEKLLGVIAVKRAGSAAPQASRAVIDQAMKPFPNVEVEDRAEFVKAQGDDVDMVLNLITVLLVLSVIIALLGVVNTIALSVVERTRELGLLRAVGMQRKQLRRMIRVESVIISVYGALLGLVVGLAFGWAIVHALSGQGITEFSVPFAKVLLVVLVAALGGVLAAALPARRAAKMDVLQAIATT
ncbi:MAG: putative transport system integral rane protein [Frankiales bacterium]|nr:putative transport system integral rane protein [Frankiales bacterium]